MTTLADIREVVYPVNQAPFAEIAALIDYDIHGALAVDVPLSHNSLDLAVNLAAMADLDDMNSLQMGMDLVNYAILTEAQAVATLFVTFQGLALEWRGGQRVNGRFDMPQDIAVGAMEMF